MTPEEINNLHLGVYKIYWKCHPNETIATVAAVGEAETEDGEIKRWIAPCTYKAPVIIKEGVKGPRGTVDVASTTAWELIEKVIPISIDHWDW